MYSFHVQKTIQSVICIYINGKVVIDIIELKMSP